MLPIHKILAPTDLSELSLASRVHWKCRGKGRPACDLSGSYRPPLAGKPQTSCSITDHIRRVLR